MPRNDRWAQVVALGGVVVDDVEDHLDARPVQRPDHRLELQHLLAAGAEAGVVVTWHGRHTASLKLPGEEPVAPTNELTTMHLVTYMEFDDGGQIKGMRVYSDHGMCQNQHTPSAWADLIRKVPRPTWL